MTLQEIINTYKEKTGYSDSQISKMLGVTRSTVMRWSNGSIKKVNSNTINKLSTLFGDDINELLNNNTQLYLPVRGYVKAGYNLLAEENYIDKEPVTSEERHKGDYFLEVSGNSMIGIGIMEGSRVLVQQTNMLKSGDIGVIMINDEVTIKRVIFKDKIMILEAANSEVENRYFSLEDIENNHIKIIGRVLSCKTYF